MARKVTLSLLPLILVAMLLTGCSKRYTNLPVFSALPIYDPENQSVGRFKTTYLADQINAYFRGSSNGPLAVTTFVDINNLYATSTFGRLLGEQLISELAMRGFDVVELRHSDVMHVDFTEGEFGLTRDIESLRDYQNISGMVVGTYTVSPLRVYLNVRIIDPKSSLIISTGSVEMAMTKEIQRLLRAHSYPQSMERIPVRSLGYGQPVPFVTRFQDPFAGQYFQYQQPTAPSLPSASEGESSLMEPTSGAAIISPDAALEPNL